jgi:NAD(P)-dependent dehydrogenase (short-subunit alcohol dehydrogenase family)
MHYVAVKNGLKPLSDLISLRGKRALVTGSAHGIGKAIAYRFAEAGADLELVDIDGEGLDALKEELSQYGVEAGFSRVDVSEKKEIDALWERLAGREPDILVNNAGIYPFRDFLEIDEAYLTKLMGINLNSVFWMCQNMIKRREKRGGVIVNMGSIEAILPFKGDLTHYNMSKAGVLALTRTLAKDYGKKGFRINALLPGGIMTPGTKSAAKEILRFNVGILKSGMEFRARLPLGRFGKPDDIACMAVVLASDLSSYVHGALIAVDGGFLSA